MPPLLALVHQLTRPNDVVVDPFARNCKLGTLTNDLNPDTNADSHLDAVSFLENLESDIADLVLIDPPFSPRQIADCYQGIGKRCQQKDTQNSRLYRNVRHQVDRIVKHEGTVLWLGWSTVGMTKSLGWALHQILLIGHGAAHNDTIATVWRRAPLIRGASHRAEC